MTDYIFFRFVGDSEMSMRQAKFFTKGWKQEYKLINYKDYSEAEIEEYLRHKVSKGILKPGRWRVQLNFSRRGKKEFGDNYYFEIGGF